MSNELCHFPGPSHFGKHPTGPKSSTRIGLWGATKPNDVMIMTNKKVEQVPKGFKCLRMYIQGSFFEGRSISILSTRQKPFDFFSQIREGRLPTSACAMRRHDDKARPERKKQMACLLAPKWKQPKTGAFANENRSRQIHGSDSGLEFGETQWLEKKKSQKEPPNFWRP